LGPVFAKVLDGTLVMTLKFALKIGLSYLKNYIMIIALITLCIAFEVITEGTFLSSRNISLLARQMTITAVLTIGAVMLLVSGNFDISTGSVLGLTGGIAAILQVWYKWDTATAIIVAIGIGMLIGAWHGYWVAYKKIASLIVTLAGLMVFRGVLLVLTQGRTIAPLQKNFIIISGGFIPKTIGYTILLVAIIVFTMIALWNRKNKMKYNVKVRNLMSTIGIITIISLLMSIFVYVLNRYLGIPLPVMILLILVLIFNFIMNRTTFGRYVYAIGGNREASSLLGINVHRNIFYLFVIMGGLSAVAGVFMTSRMNAATPTAGTGMELDAIAAAVLGGTSLSGGYGSITGGILGALIMATLDNGMSLFNISSYYQYIVKGLILILAVWFDVSIRNRKK